MSGLAAFREDRARYPPRAWALDPALWSIAAYRVAQSMTERLPKVFPVLVLRQLIQLIAYVVGGNELPHRAQIGPGFCIRHGNGIVIHEDALIGRNCTMRQGVTIGNRHDGGPVPVLGDNVTLGAYAQVLGGITIGDGATIGAMTVVLDDVPAGATAVGIPARILTPSVPRR